VESWGGGLKCHYTNGYHGPGFPGGISFVVCSVHFFPQIFQVGTALTY